MIINDLFFFIVVKVLSVLINNVFAGSFLLFKLDMQQSGCFGETLFEHVFSEPRAECGSS